MYLRIHNYLKCKDLVLEFIGTLIDDSRLQT